MIKLIALRHVAYACAGLLALAVLSLAPPAAAQSCPTNVFCGGWRNVCLRTCPAGDCTAVCTQRYNACLSSGCFHFNSPGPRCKSNPADLKLTTACSRQ